MSVKLNKQDMDKALYEIAKEYKKVNRNCPDMEIILVGGASILANYGFRDSTTDIDAIIKANSSLKEIANKVGDMHGYETGWLNEDFKKTASYSDKLVQHSKFYKKFCGYMDVRTVNDEYLIAMKMMSSRIYKKDLSDIVGVIKDMREQDKDISIGIISNVYKELYGTINEKEDVWLLVENAISLPIEELEDLYYQTLEEESKNKEALLIAEKDYSEVINEDNVESFIASFRNKAETDKKNEVVDLARKN